MTAPACQLIHGDCLAVLPTLADASVDAVVTDPPAGIKFMGLDFDTFPIRDRRKEPNQGSRHDGNTKEFAGGVNEVNLSKTGRGQFIAFLSAVMAECLRVAKPGARMLCWAIPRTSHWTATAIEDAGWIIEDRISHMFGCLSDDTEILTSKGWMPYQKVDVFDPVLAYNTDRDSFQWEPVEEVLVYDYCDTAYRIHSAHTDQIVSRNHRCLVERGGGYIFQYAETLQQRERVPILEDLSGLLRSLSLPQCHAEATEQGVFSGMLQHVDWREELGQEETRPHLSTVWQGVPTEGTSGEGIGELQVLQLLLCRRSPCRQPSIPRKPQASRGDRPGGVDGGVAVFLPGENAGGEQPSVEGRCDVPPQAWKLRQGQIRSLPEGVPFDGEDGWLCDGTPLVGGSGDRAVTTPQGGCSPRRPQPDRQPDGELETVCEQSGSQIVRASRFTRSDVVRVVPIHYEGKVWCVRVPSGAFVARRNGKVFVTGNSGFPKGPSRLKPAVEDWWLCRKPSKRVPPLNIDECRVGTDAGWSYPNGRGGSGCFNQPGLSKNLSVPMEAAAGRWPAHLILDEEAAALLDAAAGERGGGFGTENRSGGGVYGEFSGATKGQTVGYGDSGGPSRFFYCAKASAADRGEGNSHPTVKSLDLMSWLVKLITPPDGLVLDPFAGSGTTLLAAFHTNRRALGIEREPAYVEIARRRLDAATADMGLFAAV